jgi:hypothetical protein
MIGTQWDVFSLVSRHKPADVITLYRLRQLIAEHPLEVILALDAELHKLTTGELSPDIKTVLRRDGFQFYEDLDNVPKLMRGNNDGSYA